MKSKVIELLTNTDPKNYFLGLSILAGQPQLINAQIKVLIHSNLLVKSGSHLENSSSPYNGKKILEIANLGLAQKLIGNLEQIDLSYINNFEGLEALTQVKEVRFYFNHLNHLPSELFQLPLLEKLYIRLSPQLDFEKVCLDLVKFPKLEGLYLENNRLSSVPKNLLALPQLKYLRFSNRQIGFANRIKIIPDFLTKMPCLEELNFSGNFVEQFPPNLFDFARQQLKIFNIGRHNFGEGPLAVAYMKLFKDYGLKSH